MFTTLETAKDPGSVAPDQGGRHRTLLLLCLSVPSLMINLDSNIVAASLDTIGRSLRTEFASMEWVIGAYTLTFAAFVMPAESLADLFGRKRMLLTGLAIFTSASLACGAARNVDILNVARAIQSIGTALQLSAALAILSHFSAGLKRAKAFAFRDRRSVLRSH